MLLALLTIQNISFAETTENSVAPSDISFDDSEDFESEPIVEEESSVLEEPSDESFE